jgi:hypothetical protein
MANYYFGVLYGMSAVMLAFYGPLNLLRYGSGLAPRHLLNDFVCFQ